MIGSIQDALRAMIYRDARLPPAEVDVRFAAPTREFTSGVNRPTINFYLYDMIENVRLRSHDLDVRRNGQFDSRRLRPRRMDLKYLVNVFFKSQVGEMDEQEWLLLWRVLATLMRHAEWAEADLPESVRALDVGILGSVSQPDHNARLSDVWSGLGNHARPSLHYVLTVPLDLNIEFHTPLVLGQETSFRRSDTGDIAGERTRFGWQLLAPDGRGVAGAEVRLEGGLSVTTTDAGGAFFLRVGSEEARALQVRLPGSNAWHNARSLPGDYRVVLH
ncbi:DUF4255 domain-containing protein [Deinococcus peraridilitoris]|uniref:Pvc16 N-terminal domain-containing protein n=1 Tax=Deinococcus peraridilitoris (strain DSM 19664 / LMG 22246 / CIP 109416 / KR-200) TaxID=937777 RepID=L0A2D0_DEIPD|nr:DUF4255 domain-containing protein [Deinococcus peraridilitoris]AFZ67347.1 hypothetical protein Deipe_1831 [Deinococcus peraridilitoris DSM 19664]